MDTTDVLKVDEWEASQTSRAILAVGDWTARPGKRPKGGGLFPPYYDLLFGLLLAILVRQFLQAASHKTTHKGYCTHFLTGN